MNCTFEQIRDIILNNPNKAIIEDGQARAKKASMHVLGDNIKESLQKYDYFEHPDVYAEKCKYAVSNKDVIARLLQQEDMVFSARGGSSYFGLPDEQEKQMHELLADVKFGMSLRKWVKNFGLQAYRCDPMGVIFIEIDKLVVTENGPMNTPRAYPTYKSINTVYDYQTTGRRLEYVCFKLTVSEALSFGIEDDDLKNNPSKTAITQYYRFVDDNKDAIMKKGDGEVTLVKNISQENPIINPWGRTPGFIVSDLILFTNPQIFLSPLDNVIELADTFLNDRATRDLQKRYHGFAKPIEPLLQCPKCVGEGYVNGAACPDCTVPGGQKGTGYKLRTKVSDVAKFPLEILEAGFDYKRIFGYVTPDIESWEKQDSSLDDLEQLMEMTYWGTIRMRRPQPGSTPDKTATEVKSNDEPKEARLNMTADWLEKTENMIATFIGQFWFDNFKQSSITIGRDYILKTADELLDTYETLRTKGAPDFTLDEALEKYYQAKYQNNPLQLAIYLKKLDVEPFPHISMNNAKAIITNFDDYNAKLYFGEWSNTIPEMKWLALPAPKLREDLNAYVKKKGIAEPAPQPNPALN